MPEITVRYESVGAFAVLTASDDLPGSVWNRVFQTCTQADPEARTLGRTVTLSWSAALTAIIEVATIRNALGFSIRAEGEAEERLRRFKAERAAVGAARSNRSVLLTADQIGESLNAHGFTKRVLRPFQIRDVQRMLAIQNGANFSVPGAGKTTVAFAVHLLAVPANTKLLVICPKNAFAAWNSVVLDCMDPSFTSSGSKNFIRLEGTADEIRHLLESPHQWFLMTYDRLIRSQDLVSAFLRRLPAHLILDESHRIKAGDFSQRGRALLALAPLPVRKDILSGTPAPNAMEDLSPQLDFLWPGMNLGRQLEHGGAAFETLRNLYVRTTKRELGLPPVTRRFIHVPMSDEQLALYSVLKSEAVRQLSQLRTRASLGNYLKTRFRVSFQ